MTLEALAQWGEFIGGTAVLITIGYLGYQTRQTNRLLEQSTEQQAGAMLRANIDGWNQMFATILGDEVSVDIYHRLRRGEALSESERGRAELIASMFFLNLENFIIQNEKTPFVEGVEKMVPGAVQHHVREILSTQALRDWWAREKIIFSEQFRASVDSVELGRVTAENG